MPVDFEVVFRPSIGDISNQPVFAVEMKDHAAMVNGIGEPPISIVAAGKESKAVSDDPLIGCDFRQRTPGECSFRDGLVRLVNAECIVSGRPAEFVSGVIW